MPRLMYPAEEAAEQLSLGLSTVRALIKSGELRSVKIGHARRIPADALHEYVQRLDTEQNGSQVTAPTTGALLQPVHRLSLDQSGDDAGVAAPASSIENAASIH